jgi:hypothetical protein
MKQEEFNNLMEEYERTHESRILQFARDLYMVGTFIGVAYLIIKHLI